MTTRLDHVRLPKLLHPGNKKAQAVLAADMQKRAACFWATPCGRGCSVRANYQSTTVHLPPALDTGNLDIVTDAMVRTVTKRADGKAEGVVYIDRKTDAEHRVKARIVVLAASALESVRIMLNSGVANSSGTVGKYIMDTLGAGIGGQVPLLENMPLHNEDGADFGHMYSPWWLYKEQLAGKLGFARGYHFNSADVAYWTWEPPGTQVAQRRHLRPQVQAGRAALLRVCLLFRPRRDDSQ